MKQENEDLKSKLTGVPSKEESDALLHERDARITQLEKENNDIQALLSKHVDQVDTLTAMIKTYEEQQGSSEASDKELETLRLDLANQERQLESLQSNLAKEAEEKARAIEEAEQKLVQGTQDLINQIEDLKAIHDKTLEEKKELSESLDGYEAIISSLQRKDRLTPKRICRGKRKIRKA